MVVSNSIYRYARVSPKKANQIARVLRGKSAFDAIQLLVNLNHLVSARLFLKALKSAVANAENNHNSDSRELFLTDVVACEGPRLKRFMPAARGTAHPIKKRMSHLRVELSLIKG